MIDLVRPPILAAIVAGLTWVPVAAQAPVQGSAPRATNLTGARDQPGLFTQRLLLPADFCGPLHIHLAICTDSYCAERC